MKKKFKITLGLAAILFSAVGLSSCTKSFCSNSDTGRVMCAFDPGITKYEGNGTRDFVATDGVETLEFRNVKPVVAEFDNTKHEFYYTTDDPEVREYKGVGYLNSIISEGYSSGILSITNVQYNYFVKLDELVMLDVIQAAFDDGLRYSYDLASDPEGEGLAIFNRVVEMYCYKKYVASDNDNMWAKYLENYDNLNDLLGDAYVPSSDFVTLYRTKMNNYAATYRTCLATKTDKYGSYGYSTDGIFVESKSWSYAWSKGFFEGLLVYPIGWVIDQMAIGFQGLGKGPAALLAIFLITLIIRGVMMAATFKQTAANAKMTEIQPEVTKIQNKYPNANTNQYEKQRMAEEINALYKKNKINPLSTLLVMIIQFPVFICVWGALSGSSILTSGKVLGLQLSDSIRDVMFNGASWTAAGEYAGVTALFLFLLMAAAQTISMLLPQWMQKARAKKVARLGKNPAQKSQDNKMKWVTYIMLAMIIFMGFSLVSAMGVYWFVGAVISIGQTLITQAITNRKTGKRN